MLIGTGWPRYVRRLPADGGAQAVVAATSVSMNPATMIATRAQQILEVIDASQRT